MSDSEWEQSSTSRKIYADEVVEALSNGLDRCEGMTPSVVCRVAVVVRCIARELFPTDPRVRRNGYLDGGRIDLQCKIERIIAKAEHEALIASLPKSRQGTPDAT